MMNRLSDLVRLRAYANLLVQPVSRAAAVSVAELEVGARVNALVELARGDGTVRASINGQPFDLQLPFNARAGDSIALRVEASQPQLRFALEAGADVAPRAATLSETARFITALLTESEKLPVATMTASGPPLLDGAPTDSRAIANVLKSALADSGMFYEAHQAQWIADQRSFATLLREPQSRLTPLAAGNGNEGSEGSNGKMTSTPQLKELPVHRDALTVVRQQLETLETRQVVWQGTLWPGQTIEWQVAEEDSRARPVDDERLWRSRLRLTLPRLGDIDATLEVSPRGVRVKLRASTADSTALFNDNRLELREALSDAGIRILGIGVVHAG